jgi:hypothetical protein
MFKHDMRDEKPPKRLLAEGWREFTILTCREEKSKQGNDMFVFGVQDDKTGYQEDVYAVSTPKKRWFLKQILAAVGCNGSADGVYEWDIPDVINKRFLGYVEHSPNEFINRAGETIRTTQHKITDAKPIEELPPAEPWIEENQEQAA